LDRRGPTPRNGATGRTSIYVRKGISFKTKNGDQRLRATALLRASLSAEGLEKSQNIMRLNQTIAEMTQKPEEYGTTPRTSSHIGRRRSRGGGSLRQAIAKVARLLRAPRRVVFRIEIEDDRPTRVIR